MITPEWDLDEFELMTPSDAARKLKVSVRTVRREIAKGHLVAHKIGAQWRISRADLARYLAARRGRCHG